MNSFFLICAMLITSTEGVGQTNAANQMELSLDNALTEKIYDDVTTDDKSPSKNREIRLAAGLGIALQSEIQTSSDYFESDLLRKQQSLYTLSLGYEHFLTSIRFANFLVTAGIGYSRDNSNVQAKSSSGISVQDSISFQWVPMHLGAKTEFTTPLNWITPNFELGLGTNWIHQAGYIDGINLTSWIPMIKVASGAQFFAQDKQSGFCGIDLTVDYFYGLSSVGNLNVKQLRIGSSVNL